MTKLSVLLSDISRLGLGFSYDGGWAPYFLAQGYFDLCGWVDVGGVEVGSTRSTTVYVKYEDDTGRGFFDENGEPEPAKGLELARALPM